MTARIRRALVGTAVDGVDAVGVLVLDDVEFDLQRRGELAGLLGEFVGQDLKALDLLDAGVVGVDLVDHVLDLGAHRVGAVQLLGIEVVLARERQRLLGVERDQGHQVWAAVADHDRVRDPAALQEGVLEVGGRDVLAAGGDDDVLLAAGE